MNALRPVSAFVLALTVAASAERAHATHANSVEPDALRAALRAFDASRGDASIVAAQELWGTWNLDAKDAVERSLHYASTDPSHDAYARAYFSWLNVLARRRLGDPGGASRAVKALGYADDWMVLGPFENRENTGFDTALVPELEDGRPIALGRTWTSKGRMISFRHVARATAFGTLDYTELDASEGGACWYAVARMASTGDAAFHGRVSLGTAGAVKVFLDGALIGSDSVERGLDAERHAFPFQVDKAGSRLVVKTCHRAHAPALMLRVADANGERTTGARLEASPEVGAAGAPLKRKHVPPGDTGLVLRFQNREHSSVHDARMFGRYLAHSGGDDARGLYLRDLLDSLLKGPATTADALLRLNLGATRAERQALVTRAESLVTNAAEAYEVDLARIDLQRFGLAGADAMPLATALLALYPDDARAIVAAADVEAQMGLLAVAAERLALAVQRLGPIPILVEAAATHLGNAGRREESARMVLLGLARASDRLAWHRERLAWALAAEQTTVARAIIRHLDALTGHSSTMAIEIARAELRLGAVERARNRLVAGAERRVNDATIWSAISALEVGAGHPEEAVAALRRASDLAPEDSNLRRHLEALTPDKAHDDESFAKSDAELRSLSAKPPVGTRRTLARVHVTTLYPTGLTASFDQIALQPLTDDAAIESRQYSFAYDSARQVVQVRRARVIHADGSTDDASDISQANTDDPSVAMYSSQRVVLVHFPRIKAGDIIETVWRTDSLGGDEGLREAFGEVFAMQGSDATLSVDWILRRPVSRAINVTTGGPVALTRTESTTGDRHEVRIHGDDLPPITFEQNGPPADELIPRVIASGFPTWQSIGTWYRRFVAHDLVADDALRRRAKTLGTGARDVVDKVRAVYDWVVQNTRYVALEFGVHGYEPYPTWEVAQRGWGDCKDKASLIVVLLRELGVDAELVLLRTTTHGRRYEGIPTHAIFDHAIAYVPAMDLFLDGTAENTGMRELPWMDRGATGLRITPDGGRLVTLPETSPDETFETSQAKLVINAQGSLDLHWSGRVEGARAHDWRVRFGAEGTRKGRLEDELAATFTGLRIDTVTGGGLDDRTRGPALEFHGVSGRFVGRTDKSFAVPVAPSPFLEASFAAPETRTSTLWFSRPVAHHNRWQIELPAGAVTDEVPGDVHLKTAFAQFDRTLVRTGSNVTVSTYLAFTASHIEPSEYAAFREFCRRVDRASAERLRWMVSP